MFTEWDRDGSRVKLSCDLLQKLTLYLVIFHFVFSSARAQPSADAESYTASQLRTAKLVSAKRYLARRVADCGVRCAFVFLKMYHWDGTYDAVRSRIPTSDQRGASMADLQAALASLGQPVRAFRCVPELLDRLPVPAIAHLEPAGKPEHYIIVIGVNERDVRLLDPTTLEIGSWDRETFARRSSGYFLATISCPFNLRSIFAFLGVGVGLIVVSVWCIFGAKRNSRKGQ